MKSLTCLKTANTLQKLPIIFTKFNENSMEAKSAKLLQHGRDSCNFFTTFSLKHTLSGSGAKVTRWLTIIYYFLFMLCIAFTLSNNNLAHFHHFCFVFVALRPMSTAMVIAGRSVHLTTLFPGQA